MKKIAIVKDGWRQYVNYAWISGCRDYIAEHNLDAALYVCNSFGNFNKDEKYNLGEYNISRLMDFSEFDGVIVELTNVSIPEQKERILQEIRTSGVPAVSLVEEQPGFHYVGIDNYGIMAELVEHVITVHGARTLNYIGGPEDSQENRQRFQAYQDVLSRHGIPVEKTRVYQQDYEISTGESGFCYFQNKELIPDAFICANDNIAVGVLHEAEKSGYHAPVDFMVTGFDNFDKASVYSPRITTVAFTREEIADKAMEKLDSIWKGETTQESLYAPATCIFQESCGCKREEKIAYEQYVVNHIWGAERDSERVNETQELKRTLIDCTTYEELACCMAACLQKFHCQDVDIKLNQDMVSMQGVWSATSEDQEMISHEGYPQEMCSLLGGWNKQTVEDTWCPPGERGVRKFGENNGALYLFSPLHFRDREIGYLCLTNCDYLLDNQLLFELLNIFQEALENLHSKIMLKRANQELSALYMQDSLTGLYNRMAYSKLALPLFTKCVSEGTKVAVLFVDVNELKYINDTFGHDMGNKAITVVAKAVSRCCPQEAVSMRYGGDEFVILVPGATEADAQSLQDTLTEQMTQISKELEIGFPVSASIGYAIAADVTQELGSCIDRADESMYKAKKQRKKLHAQ